MEATIGRCRNCGHDVATDARFCAQCGEALRDLQPRAGTGMLPANRKLHSGRFIVLRKLAQGGQSAVYLAMDTATGDRRAIKELGESQLAPAERQKAINDFLREGVILGSLNHPNLCRVTGTFVEDNRYFLVMEYIEGHNLEDELIGIGRALEWPRVVGWGITLCDVLGYLHAQVPPIVYRDLKPSNVMLRPDDSIKLIDFGIARQLLPQRSRDTARLGTDGYAPIEQYSGRSEPRSDVYALGASLYHLLTGRIPEAAPLRSGGHVLTPARALNSSIPEALDRVIQQALVGDAERRFPNAFAMRQALEWAAQMGGMRTGGAQAGGMQPGVGRATNGPASSIGGRPLGGINSAPPGYAPNSVPPGYAPVSAPPGYAPGSSGAFQAPRVPANSGPYPVPRVPNNSGAYPVPRPPGNSVSMPIPRATGGPASLPPVPVGPRGPMGTPTGAAVSPHLRLWPVRLDLGVVAANQSAVQVIELSNRGGGQLMGAVETNSACVSVDPPRVDPATSQLYIHVNTAGLAMGEYRCHVAVRTNGGDHIIPVRFVVMPGGAPEGDLGGGRQ